MPADTTTRPKHHECHTHTLPGLRRLQHACLGLCAALYLGVVALGWPYLVFALALEDAPLAWMQASLLIACASAAALRASLSRAYSAWGWALLALSLVGAALDERFMGHERVQAWLANTWGDGSDAALRLSQCLLLLGLGPALAGLWWLRGQMHPAAWRWGHWAAAVGISAVLLDVATVAPSPAVLEESLEFWAEALMLTGLLSEARIQASQPS